MTDCMIAEIYSCLKPKALGPADCEKELFFSLNLDPVLLDYDQKDCRSLG